MSENNNHEERDKELLKKAFRWRKPILEKLVMQRLFQATMSHDPFVIIEHTVNAASMIDTQKQKVTGLDFAELKRITRINNAFKNSVHHQGVYVLNFPFEETEENFKLYIKPWQVTGNYYPHLIREHIIGGYKVVHNRYLCDYPLYTTTLEDMKEIWNLKVPKDADLRDKIVLRHLLPKIPVRCPKCKILVKQSVKNIDLIHKKMVYPYPKWSFWFEMTKYLSATGFLRLRDSFNCWAKDKCGAAISAISAIITPNTYDEVARQFRSIPEELEKKQE